MRYDQAKDSTDGLALARALADLGRRIDGEGRVSAGLVPDPTPAATDVSPGSVTRLTLEDHR